MVFRALEAVYIRPKKRNIKISIQMAKYSLDYGLLQPQFDNRDNCGKDNVVSIDSTCFWWGGCLWFRQFSSFSMVFHTGVRLRTC